MTTLTLQGALPTDRKFSISHAAKLIAARRIDEAWPIVKELIDDDVNDTLALHLWAEIETVRENFGTAANIFQRVHEAEPERASTLINIARCLNYLFRHEEALMVLDQAKALDGGPQYELWTNYASVYLWSNQPEKCIEACKKSLEINPGNVPGYDIQSIALLFLGRWEEGWDMFEMSLGYKYRKEFTYGEEERWDGTKGQTLMVFGEQGLGDEIMFCSCLDEVIRDNNVVHVDTQKKLGGLIRRSFPKAIVHATRHDESITFDEDPGITSRVAMGSIPRFYRRQVVNCPGTPYLTADIDRRMMARGLLDSLGKDDLKVGIAWRGGVRRTGMTHRSIPLEQWAEILALPCRFISLEYRKADMELNEYPQVKSYPFLTMTDDYDDTAALVAELDLVISICTTVVHLAGGLGVECWCLVNSKPNWRFSPAAETADHKLCWTQSVEIFRQEEAMNWAPVMEEIRKRLYERIHGLHRNGVTTTARGDGPDVEHHPTLTLPGGLGPTPLRTTTDQT